jgi:hypothetical protein
MNAPSEGHITVDGAPVQSAEVFLLDADGSVRAVAPVHKDGSYELPRPAIEHGLLLAKLYRPTIGARVLPPRETDLSVTGRDEVTLRATLRPPPGVALSDVDVHLTPLSVPNLPPSASGAVLALGTDNRARTTFATIGVQPPTGFTLRALRGKYELRVERYIEQRPRSQVIETAAVSTLDGQPLPVAFGGVVLDLMTDTELVITLSERWE